MYLDTDVILALVKEDDWLKKYIDVKKLKSMKTSVLNIIEAQLILEREYSREEAVNVLFKIKKFDIEIFSVDKRILDKSLELRQKYSKLNIFDSVHAASAITNKEVLVSTDTVFPDIEGLESIDPRHLNNSKDEKD